MCGASCLTRRAAASAAAFCWKVEVNPMTSGACATIRRAISSTNSGTTWWSACVMAMRDFLSLPRMTAVNSSSRQCGSS